MDAIGGSENAAMSLVRVASHVHSEWSYDGKWRLPQLAASFAKRGYRVVLMTEHDRGFDESRRLEHRLACQEASSEKILLVPGIEYSDPTNVIHFLVWGDVPFVGSAVEPDRVLASVQENEGVAVFAHPSRKEAWRRFDPAWHNKVLGIEFWNRKTDGWAPSKHAWPLLRMTNCVAMAGLDFHDSRQFFPMVTFVELEGSISETSVLAALRKQRCRSKVLGLEPSALTDGLHAEALRGADGLRRVAARWYRTALRVHSKKN
jgi:hypothetical protein